MPRLKELTIQYRPHPSGIAVDNRAISDSRTAAAILVPMLEHQAQEIAVILLLNIKHKVIAVHEVNRGGITETLVDPRIVFRAALLANAPALVFAHNHPSGDCEPSPEDLNLTRRLIDGGNLLGIDVLDHLIIGDRCYFSFKETGRL